MPETFRSVCFNVFKGKKVLLLNNISFTLVDASDRLSLQMKYIYQSNIADVKISLTLRNGYLFGSSS